MRFCNDIFAVGRCPVCSVFVYVGRGTIVSSHFPFSRVETPVEGSRNFFEKI